MKQNILLRVVMNDDRTRAKAMKTAVQFKGVNAVEIKGDHRNQIQVTGVEVDMIALINTLRRKVAFAELVSVSKVEPPKEVDKNPDEEKPVDKKPDDEKPVDKKPDEENPVETKGEEKKPEPCCQPCQSCHCQPCSCCQPCQSCHCQPCSCSQPCSSYQPCSGCHCQPCSCYQPCSGCHCQPCSCYQPWPHGYGVPCSYPYPCDPYHQMGEPVYNHEPNCRIM